MKSTIVTAALVAAVSAQQSAYGQCGGSGYTGPTSCVAGYSCVSNGAYYAQCTPAASVAASSTAKAATTTAKASSTAAPATTAKASTTAAAPSSSKAATTSSAAAASSSGKVAYAGVNIAGCDFGIDTSGNAGTPTCPTTVGATQMQHFTSQDGLNIFRIPGGWQYFVANTLGGTLDPTFFKEYDTVMQACLATGSHCILDVHNYARWNGGIIGQGGPTNAQFANLWSQLAAKYASDSKVIFGIMNEPHDLTMSTWAVTVQAAVTAIRAAGATSQMILLPGTGYTSAAGFETNSAPALSTVKDSDGTVNKLIYDIHKYMDSDGSGTSSTCVSNEISSAFQSLATYLRTNKRQAFLSETGGGNTASCEQYVCQALAYLNQNSDVYLGWTGWAAGSFDTSYVLSETPNGNTDQPIVAQCIAGEF